MWFLLALLSNFIVTARRTTEKRLAGSVDPSTMAWLQQAAALPFTLVALPFAPVYNPLALPPYVLGLLGLYTLLTAADLALYFKAISVGDLSVVTPLMTLSSAAALAGSYVILHQVPSRLGLLAVVVVAVGAYLAAKPAHPSRTALNNRLAVWCILGVVAIRGIYSPIEVVMLRQTNPLYFNALTSLLALPVLVLLAGWLHRGRPQPPVAATVKRHFGALAVVGFTYAASLALAYTARLLTPNVAYVTSVRSASLLPVVIIGAVFFHEHLSRRQWTGIALILVSLGLFAIA